MIDRREALKRTTFLLGGMMTAGISTAILSGCKPKSIALDWTPEVLTADQARSLAELVERIIPATDIPGAKATMVDRFIDAYLKDIASEEEQLTFSQGMSQLEEKAISKGGKSYADLSDEERDAILTEISGVSSSKNSEDQKAAELANEGEKVLGSGTGGTKFFDMVRQLTITGFFTSEIGAKEALKLDEIPGQWSGCIPYSEIGGAWAL